MNLDDYDGTTSRNAAIKKYLGLTTPASWSKHTKRACVALGLAVDVVDGKRTTAENKSIVDWLRADKKANEPPPPPKTRNKTKRENRFNQFKRISFNVTGNTQRQHISLEPEFIKALELIAPDNKLQWLSDTVSDYIAKNGIESTTRIIKSSIVNALIERATVVKK